MPNASFVQDSGEVIVERAAIREVMNCFIAIKLKFTVKSRSVLSGDGSLTLTGLKRSATGIDADGKQATLSGNSAEVVRRLNDDPGCCLRQIRTARKIQSVRSAEATNSRLL